MKKPETSVVPEFYRQAGYMAGHYILTDECDVDSKYFRYQGVPADGYAHRDGRYNNPWTYSENNERQYRFYELIDEGVLSEEVAQYLEEECYSRTNMFFVGGDEDVRLALMEAVVATRSVLNPVRATDSFLSISPEKARQSLSCPVQPWVTLEDAGDKLLGRNDVLVYDGTVPDDSSRETLLRHAVHHIVVAGFSEASDEQILGFMYVKGQRRKVDNFNCLVVRLGDVEARGRGTVSGISEILNHENYYNGTEHHVSWKRVAGELRQIHSTVVY